MREVKRERLSQLISTTTCEPESSLLRRKGRNQKKTKTQTKLNPQTLQSKQQQKQRKYQEKTMCAYLKESTPKTEGQSHDVSLKIHF